MRCATVKEVISVAENLWNLTYVVRAGRYFAWRLLRLTGLHDPQDQSRQNGIVTLGEEFHADLHFWRWAIEHGLLQVGEALNAPCYFTVKRPP